MTLSIRAIIRGLVAPKHRLSCSPSLWYEGLSELHRRGNGQRESGAFLLGRQWRKQRAIHRFIYYDELDPHCLDTGIVVLDGAGYGPLWQCCRTTGLNVVADIHTHPGQARQSAADRDHPMIATPGHVALIIPNFAQRSVAPAELGIYEYLGDHCWHNYSGAQASYFFYIGRWG